MSKYSMYNGVWYDGISAGVCKFILSTDETQATHELHEFLEQKNCGSDFIKLDKQSQITLSEIIALRQSGIRDNRQAFKYFAEMYFGEMENIE